MSTKPDVSIITCHHRGDFIYKFVESVKKSFGVNYEIIIMTSDEKLALNGIPHCWVHYHEGLPAAKRNAGVRMAAAQCIAFFDDDVEIGPDCLYELRKTLLFSNNIGMVYGKLYKADEPTRLDEAGGYLTSSGFIWSRAGQNIIDEGQFSELQSILAGKSASCMTTKRFFNMAGGFDEDFGILGEETDLSWRIWLKGYCVLFCPSAIGIHYFNTKWKPANEYYTSKRVHYNGCRNYITMLIKNLEAKNLWTILPKHILIWFFAGCAMLITGKLHQGWNILMGIGYIIKNLKHIIGKRSQIQSRRSVNDDDIWPEIFRSPPRGYYLGRIRRYISIGLHG